MVVTERFHSVIIHIFPWLVSYAENNRPLPLSPSSFICLSSSHRFPQSPLTCLLIAFPNSLQNSLLFSIWFQTPLVATVCPKLNNAFLILRSSMVALCYLFSTYILYRTMYILSAFWLFYILKKKLFAPFKINRVSE